MSNQLHSLLRDDVAHNGTDRDELGALYAGHFLDDAGFDWQQIRVLLRANSVYAIGELLQVILRRESIMGRFEQGSSAQGDVDHWRVVLEIEGLGLFKFFVVGTHFDDLHIGEVLNEGSHQILIHFVPWEQLMDYLDELLLGTIMLLYVNLFELHVTFC